MICTWKEPTALRITPTKNPCAEAELMRRTKLIPWQLMPSRLASSGHQQLCYRLWRPNVFLSSESYFLQYIPRNMHMVFALLCIIVVIHWLIFPYPSGLLHWHCGNLTIAPVPAKRPWWIWINTSYEFIMNDCITTKKQGTTKPCAYFLGYTVVPPTILQDKAQNA